MTTKAKKIVKRKAKRILHTYSNKFTKKQKMFRAIRYILTYGI